MMVPAGNVSATPDPIELVAERMECVWLCICGGYDVIADLPCMETLFDGADLRQPEQAAESVIVNMLLDVMACVDRFSPWYTRPARDYGLTRIHNARTNQVEWILTSDALRERRQMLDMLTTTIRQNVGLIQMLIVMDQLMTDDAAEEYIIAACCCLSPRYIQVQRSVLKQTEILCDRCQEPFQVIE